MKAGKEHRVPLSAPAITILEEMTPPSETRRTANGAAADAFVLPRGKHG